MPETASPPAPATGHWKGEIRTRNGRRVYCASFKKRHNILYLKEKKHMKTRILIIAAMTTLVIAFALAGCASPAEGGVVTIDLTAGRNASCFEGLSSETLPLEVIRQGETLGFLFEGVSLDRVLTSQGISDFSKIELVVSDMDENMDVTEAASAEAGMFIAWSESGEPENPARVFPKDAATGNLLIRNVTAILVTP
jgi:hypothetical protein